MRFPLLLLLSAALATGASAAEVAITRVFTGWRDAASFKRISEYFTGRENPGDTVVLRTHPEQRSGFYFLVRVINSGTPVATKVTLELITPNDHQTKTYTFSTELKSGTTLLNLGLTAGDWPDDKANPVAWKLDLVDGDGKSLAGQMSYLWEKPEAK